MLLNLLAAVGLLGALPAAAGSPQVALVEAVHGNVAGVEFMDYLTAGQVVRLGAADTITISYLNSCVRETITGGTVTVGAQQSEVQSGKVERANVKCDSGRMLLTTEQANQSAGMAFRSAPHATAARASLEPQFTLYGVSPVLEISGKGTLVIERADQAGEHLVVHVPELARGAFMRDLADEGTKLSAGGTYRARFDGQEIVFKIDADAEPGKIPIVSRLLRIIGTS